MLVQEVAVQSIAHNWGLQRATHVLRQRCMHCAELLLEAAQGAVIHDQARHVLLQEALNVFRHMSFKTPADEDETDELFADCCTPFMYQPCLCKK